jgi:hypothetical protein
MRFVIDAIPSAELARLRAQGHDDFGTPWIARTYDEGGHPLRCCLREAEAGEALALVAYRPFAWDGPYAEVGPVFVHVDACPGYPDPDAYPEAFRHRQQIFRAYGFDHSIIDAEIVEGSDAERTIAKLLSRPDVDFVHSRNVNYGCYMFAITR